MLALPAGGSLSAPLCAALRDSELTDTFGFRGLFDSSASEAEQMVGELGGEPGDVVVLVALWSQAAMPASQLEGRLSQIPSPSDVADAIIFDRANEKKRRKQHMDGLTSLNTSMRSVAKPVSTTPGAMYKRIEALGSPVPTRGLESPDPTEVTIRLRP